MAKNNNKKAFKPETLVIKSPDHLTTYTSPPTKDIAYINPKDWHTDPMTKKTTLGVQSSIFEYQDYEVDKIRGSSILADKIMKRAIAEFTRLNSKDNLNNPKTEIAINLLEFIDHLGYDSSNETTVKNRRKDINKALNELYNMSVKSRNKSKNSSDYFDTRIIYNKGIRNGYITVNLVPELAKYIIKNDKINALDTKILSISGNKPNTYLLAIKISERLNYNLAKNNDRLTIKTLLSYTQLPTIEEVQANQNSWRERIQEPFYKALEELTEKNIIQSYKTARSNNKDLEDFELVDIDFKEWSELLIYYEK